MGFNPNRTCRRGFVAIMVIVIMALLIATVVIGMQRAIIDQRGVLAFERNRQSLGERRAIKNHLTEFSLESWYNLIGRTPNPVDTVPTTKGFAALQTEDAAFTISLLSGDFYDVTADSFYPNAPSTLGNPDVYVDGIDFIGGQILSYGPVQQVAEVSFEVTKNAGSTATYSSDYSHIVDVKGWSVPLVNFPLIAYGKPSETVIGDSMEASGVSVIGDRSPIALTDLDAVADSTAFADLDVGVRWASGSADVMPYSYRPFVSLCWDAFDYVLGSYQNDLRTSSSSIAFDFAQVPDVSSMPSGMSYAIGTNTLTLDAHALAGTTVFIYDYYGGGTVDFDGSSFASGDAPIVINIRNTVGLPPTDFTFIGNSQGYCMLYANNTDVRIDSNAVAAGIFLDNGSMLINNEAGDTTRSVIGNIFFPAGSDALEDADDIELYSIYHSSTTFWSDIQAAAQLVSPRALMVTSTAKTE